MTDPCTRKGDTLDLSVGTLFDVRGKVCVVTGGGTGLGEMMATALVQNGAKRVYISSRKLKNLTGAAERMNASHPGVVVPLESDLSSKAGCDALGAQIASRESRIDVLINNSGLAWGSLLTETPEDKGWDKVMAVNVKAAFYLTVALLPLLKVGKTMWETGSVINISSILSYLPIPYSPSAAPSMGTWSYLASKAAISHLTRSMSVKLMPSHITVNAIAPGFYPSLMTKHSQDGLMDRSHPSQRQGSPGDIAALALLLSSRAGSHLSGQVLTTDGGMTLSPIRNLPDGVRERYLPIRDADGRAKL